MLETQLENYKNDNISLREKMREKYSQHRVLSKKIGDLGSDTSKIEFPIVLKEK